MRFETLQGGQEEAEILLLQTIAYATKSELHCLAGEEVVESTLHGGTKILVHEPQGPPDCLFPRDRELERDGCPMTPGSDQTVVHRFQKNGPSARSIEVPWDSSKFLDDVVLKD
jgi:hypothetical protein